MPGSINTFLEKGSRVKMPSQPPRVFISYSHDSPEHAQHVLELAERLRTRGGVDAWIDLYRPDPDEGWIRWMRENIERADRVLLVFTETYARRFLGKEAPGKCGDLPLALAMIGAMVRMDPRPTAWRDVLARLRRADLAAIKVEIADYPYPNLLRTIEVSVEGLESADRERYFDLAVFPEDQPVPESALSVLWKLDAIDTRGCMARLATSSLAGWAMGDRAFQISAGVPHR